MTDKMKSRNVFEAIADPTRRELIHILSESEAVPLYKLTVHFDMGRTAVTKHLTILWEADLVKKSKVGRETHYQLNPIPLKEVSDWVTYYQSFWENRMQALQEVLEEENK
ncbi:metalloregulator ArsR/SmtB family transcription factor [Alkalibacterium indicireducens]|uniref:Metalloregulator ArsR/SmtB family transcription factor n=1 Tax=Alkalibacterium indicireducens TaxID=398758 RepID=A0ABN1B5J8_9LACT